MIAETRIDEATDWFLRVRAEDAVAEDFAPLQQWLQAHPDNAAAYRRVCAMWAAIDDIASSPEVIVGRRDALDDAHRIQQQRRSIRPSPRFWQSIAACIVAVALLALLMQWTNRNTVEVYETGIGERRALTLPDGSLVNLDARTRIEVHYSARTRTLRLEKGQASFKVHKDPARPFRVSSNGQTVVALGTEFNVDVLADKLVVTLIEGHVAIVQDLAAGTSPAIELNAGQQLLSTVGHSPEIRSHIDVSHAVGWQSGKLFFSDEPLSSAVARINRYSATPIEVDPSVERIRIGGTFRAGDTTTFTEAVSTYFPVDVVRTETGAIRMTARTGP